MIGEIIDTYSQYDWSKCLETESLVLAWLFHRIPTKRLKEYWPSMQVSAMIGNANGGKSKSSEPVNSDQVFTPLDFIPPFAKDPSLEKEYLLKPQHCWLMKNMVEGGQLKDASWVVHLVELDDEMSRIIEVGRGFDKVMELERLPVEQ